MKVQVRRFPAEYEDTPWSVWITLPTGVQGVTMTPTGIGIYSSYPIISSLISTMLRSFSACDNVKA